MVHCFAGIERMTTSKMVSISRMLLYYIAYLLFSSIHGVDQ